MNHEINNKKNKIVKWLNKYVHDNKSDGFIIGVSGGVDSALTSTLCCLTGKKVFVLNMPIYQEKNQLSRAKKHMDWLCNKFSNVCQDTVDLTETFDKFSSLCSDFSELSLANTRSRLRMSTLYAFANTKNLLVAGTGNKIEDYGIGFFTKYGDGGVDLSPIADLMKSEVREMSKHLGILEEIVNAIPTDGLWKDGRSDEEQIGASYEELEWALKYYDKNGDYFNDLQERQIEILKIYIKRHNNNKHKLKMPPICYL
jgi:NAD+ synthase